jgi:hypothetical protein
VAIALVATSNSARRGSRPGHVDWRGSAFPRKLHEHAARHVQDRRLCARGWTSRPLSFRLLGYLTRLMRALTSPCVSSSCASSLCASSQYLRSFPKKSLASFAFAHFSAPMIFYKTPTHISIPLSAAFSGAIIELRA